MNTTSSRPTIHQLQQAMKWWNALTREQQQEFQAQDSEAFRAADRIARYWLAHGQPEPQAQQVARHPNFQLDHLPDGTN